MNTMNPVFAPLTADNAPEGSREMMGEVKKGFGFVPNLIGTMANSPELLEGYLTLSGIFDKTSFTADERQIVFLTASVENDCSYCTAAHSTALGKHGDVVRAIREGGSLSDEKIDALVLMTRELVSKKGHLSDGTLEKFLAAGYAQEQVLEILIGVAMKTMTNTMDHVSPVEIDEVFAGQA